MIRRVILGAALLAAAPVAVAQTPVVDAARTAGGVGERYDGFIGVASTVSPLARSQVRTINIQRRTLYSNFATSRGVSPSEVGITAGCQLLARVKVGEAYMLADGVWRRRAAGQPVPVPDYCGG